MNFSIFDSKRLKKIANVSKKELLVPFSIFLILFLTYSPVVLSSYAFFDDYYLIVRSLNKNSLNFYHESSEGRPLYGLILWISFHFIHSIESLSHFRLVGLLFLQGFALFLYFFLKRRNIFENKALDFLFPIFISLIPAIQLFVAWYTTFPYILGLLLSGISYFLSSNQAPYKKTLWVFSYLMLTSAFFIYQISGLVFIFFLFLDICLKSQKIQIKKLFIPHLILFLSMASSFVYFKVLPFLIFIYSRGRGERIFLWDIPGRIHWILKEVFFNTLQTYDINYSSYWSYALGVFLFGIGIISLPKFSKKDFSLRLSITLETILLSLLPYLYLKNTADFNGFRTLVSFSLIITSLCLLGFYTTIKLIFRNEKIQFLIGFIFLIYILILTQYNLLSSFVIPNKAEYDKLKHIISSIPEDFNGVIYLEKDLSENFLKDNKAERYTLYEFHNYSFNWGYALPMAKSILNDLNKEIPIYVSPETPPEDKELFIIEADQILKNSKFFRTTTS